MSLATVQANFANAPHIAATSYNPPPSSSLASAPLPSEALLRGHKTVQIAHNGNLYKLQATKLGKLILTK